MAGSGSGSEPPGFCEGDLCGVNGGWLGQGVAFRTLHLDHTPNPQNLVLTRFQIGNGTAATMDVDRDVLIGTTSTNTLRADRPADIAKLKGSVLTIQHLVPTPEPKDEPRAVQLPRVDVTYTLTIQDIQQYDYLAQSPCPEGPPCARNKATVYTFTAVASDGCEIELCKPGLDPDHGGGLMGRAVIFRGDLYGEPDALVKRVTPAQTGDGAKINFACVGTSLSKLHLLRHTVASQMGTVAPPSVSDEKALFHLLRADYCGTGRSFTEDGLPLRLGVIPPAPQPTVASKFRLDDAVSLDALWNQDGAMCIGTPRWLRGAQGWTEQALRDEIQAECAGATPPRVIPSCTGFPGITVAAPFGIGNYAVSANPGS